MARPARLLSVAERRTWRALQAVVFLVGLAIVLALVFAPALGLKVFWDVLIPVAPALLVFAPGVWRNICPLGTASLLARHLDASARRRLSPSSQGWLALGSLILLLGVVPLRHVLLDVSGPATAAALAVFAVLAVTMGLAFEWKSAWCSGLCPIHPVEKLYGIRPAVTTPNAHCVRCERCTAVCPDSTPAMHPLNTPASRTHLFAGTVLVGGFAGYVWGWYQVPHAPVPSWDSVLRAYAFPFAGLAATLALFLLLLRVVPLRHGALLIRCFAAAAVSCYYWYRFPALLGFTGPSGRGVLVDLRTILPEWFPIAARVGTTALFAWWFLLRRAPRRPWAFRPPYAGQQAREVAAPARAG